VILTTIDLGAKRCNDLLAGSIIPGNLNFGSEGEKFIFQQLLPLEVQGHEGQFHRETTPSV